MQVHVESDLKNKIKDAFIELLENDRERLYPIFQEIMEDIALSKAMEEGEQTPEVGEDKIFQLLSQ